MDTRITRSFEGSGTSTHNDLSGLQGGTAGEYYHLTSAQYGVFSGTDQLSQYALLAGRSGGQLLYGGTLSSNNLTLDSTSHSTKGKIQLNSDLHIAAGKGIFGSATLGLEIYGSTASGVDLQISSTSDVSKGTILLISDVRLFTGYNLSGTNGLTITGGQGASNNLLFATTSHVTKGLYKFSELTSNGFVKTSSSDGRLSIDTNTYLTGNQTVTLSGDVAGSGATAITTTIANDAVTYAKIQNVSNTDKLLGRVSASAGDIEEVTCTDFAQSFLDDADATAGRATLGLGTMAVETATAYALLAGRAGGQTLNGGTASGDDLTLSSTAHGTKGNINFGNSTYDEVNNRLGIGVAPRTQIENAGTYVGAGLVRAEGEAGTIVGTGIGAEMGYSSGLGIAYIQAYDRTNSVYAPYAFIADTMQFHTSGYGTSRLTIDASGNVNFAGAAGFGIFGATPVGQQTMGAATAGATYGATEQAMLQAVYNAVRTFGFGT